MKEKLLKERCTSMLVPFWDWQKKQPEINSLLREMTEEDCVKFHYPLLKDCLSSCNCVITSKKIEITPKCIPIYKISSLKDAARRIFMSATLADDSIFVTALGLYPNEISGIITPEKANDIGDRLIIFPHVMNNRVSDDEIKMTLKKLSKQYNVVIIVPSYDRSDYWSDVADLKLNYQNLVDGVTKLKSTHVGLAVLINKYDGIDLPDEACRILVIDGLPNMQSEYDIYEQKVNPHSRRLYSEQVQKIEQGMGRGIRSNNDYCVVVLLGRSLANIIYNYDGCQYFSDATKRQYQLSEQLWDQLSKPDVETMFSLVDYSLSRNINWLTLSKDTLSSVTYNSIPSFNSTAISLRKAFDYVGIAHYQDAVAALEEEKNRISDQELKGLLKQTIAEYTNFLNPEKAQQLLLSAIEDNRSLLKPIQGIQFSRVLDQNSTQSQFFINYNKENNINPNAYILRINAILDELVFSHVSSNRFEEAIKNISFLIGIFSNRPENDYGRGPDNFWTIGNMKFFVIECKNETTTNVISKHDCNQLNGSINWFSSQYNNYQYVCYPIMIHNSNIFEHACSPDISIRIITPNLLEEFKANVRNFSQNVVLQDSYNNPTRVTELLSQFKLLGSQIVDNFTCKFKMRNL